MKPKPRLLLPSITAGIGMAAILQVLALLAAQRGLTTLSRFLDWPGTLMQSALPCTPIPTAVGAGCEATPLHLVASLASLPVSAVIYSWLVYLVLKKRTAA